ncbi:interferon regulatory factor 8-like isoform X2 [Mytilus galloprovincialis]|uniref:interferon regulatory factor 8-like isoform X2 n=1 Tax=Mytilus galloprovincialis TaxID=29158 RepID=UPI003F7CB647
MAEHFYTKMYSRNSYRIAPKRMDPHTRQRMRPWLEAKIEAGQIRGLEWIDRNQKIFKVPWKHGGKHDWNEQDSQIFKEWALHTGRFREGVDQSDWPTWKTRFRCALNKLPDIHEMKTYGRLDGPEPYRSYRFLSKHEITYPSKEPVIDHHDDSNSPRSSQDYNMMDDQNVEINSMPEKVIKGEIDIDENIIPSGNLPSDLRDLRMQPISNGLVKPVDGIDAINPTQGNNSLQDREVDPTMVFKLGYRHVDLGSHTVHNSRGCRLYYGPSDMELNVHLQNEIYGPNDVDQVHFPLCFLENKKQEEMTLTLLNYLDRGIIIRVQNGQIIATRKCRCTIFVQLHNSPEPVKLNRDEPTIIFDYFNWFEPSLHRYINDKGPRPSAEVMISFGQKWCGGETEFRNNLIWSKIYLEQAYQQLCKVTCTSPLSPNIEISRSDNIDQFLRHRQEAVKQLNGYT